MAVERTNIRVTVRPFDMHELAVQPTAALRGQISECCPVAVCGFREPSPVAYPGFHSGGVLKDR